MTGFMLSAQSSAQALPNNRRRGRRRELSSCKGIVLDDQRAIVDCAFPSIQKPSLFALCAVLRERRKAAVPSGGGVGIT